MAEKLLEVKNVSKIFRIGGMLMGYEKTGDMAKAFRYGIAAGAASVMTEGTQLIVRSDFEKLLAQVKVQEV